MKRISILIGLVLIMILIPGLKTEVFGQTQCCTTGTYDYHYYLNSSGWCEQSSIQECGSNNCVQCNYYAFMQCITGGHTWNPSTCSCIPNCSSNSPLAQSCYAQPGMMWNSSSCTCVPNPSYNPCDYAMPVQSYGYWWSVYTCSGCLACGHYGYDQYVEYWAGGQYCYTYIYYDLNYYSGCWEETSCSIGCCQ